MTDLVSAAGGSRTAGRIRCSEVRPAHPADGRHAPRQFGDSGQASGRSESRADSRTLGFPSWTAYLADALGGQLQLPGLARDTVTGSPPPGVFGRPFPTALSKRVGRVVDFQDHPNRKPAVLTVTQPLTPGRPIPATPDRPQPTRRSTIPSCSPGESLNTCTAASATTPATTNTPPGHTAPQSRLDTLRPWDVYSAGSLHRTRGSPT